jgi:tetratricopeptide (TPR) repeat protein
LVEARFFVTLRSLLMQHRIKLADLYAAPGFIDPTDGTAPSLDDGRVAALYAFLPKGISFAVTPDELVIVGAPVDREAREEAAKLFDRASKRARAGDQDKAIQLYSLGLAIEPLHDVARRDLAMSLMAKGDKDGAGAELRRLLLLFPADAWAWVILGNLNFRQNFALAERYFRRAVELSPTDAYAWNGMGVMYSEKGDFRSAVASFEAALRENPTFAQAHFGLAVALADSGELQKGFEALERMFRAAVVTDTRSLPTFQRASVYYRELATRLGEATLENAEAEIATLAEEAEKISGYPVVFEDGEFNGQMTGLTEMAWKYGRDHHVVRIRGDLAPVVKLHLKAHELCHILLESEARNAGANRWFMTDEEGERAALEEISHELEAIRKSLPPASAERLLDRLFKGLMAQLFNLPLDMVIEHRIATHYPALRFAQIQSISLMLEEAVKGCTSPEILKLVPRRILHASRFLNACYAAFVDQLFTGALAAGRPYVEMGAMERGTKLYEIWRAASRPFSPGDEYGLVDQFGADLRLRSWFDWRRDTGEPAPARPPEGSTNPALLALKSPAAVFYFLDILKRFDGMEPEAIARVAAESAQVGASGLNYASGDKTYEVPGYGPELLSGLEVMCLMYAAFQRVAPQHDLRIDLHDAYAKALAMHEERKRHDR